MDLAAIAFLVVVIAIILLIYARRTVVWVRPGEVAEVTRLGLARPPLGPGFHYVDPMSQVHRRRASGAEGIPATDPAIGERWTVVRPTNSHVPSGSIRRGSQQNLALSPGPLPIGARVVVAGGPIRFLIPEFVPEEVPPPPAASLPAGRR